MSPRERAPGRPSWLDFDETPTGAVVFGWHVERLSRAEARALAERLSDERSWPAPLGVVPNGEPREARGTFSVVVGFQVAVVRGDVTRQGVPGGETALIDAGELAAAESRFEAWGAALRDLIAEVSPEADVGPLAAAHLVCAGALATASLRAPAGLFELDSDVEEPEVAGGAEAGVVGFRLEPGARATLVVQYD